MSRAAKLIEGLTLVPGGKEFLESSGDSVKTGYKCSSKYIVNKKTGEVFGLDLNMMSFKDAWAEIEKYKDHKDDLVVLFKDEGGLWNTTTAEGPTGEVVSFKVTEAVDKNGTPIFAGLTVETPEGTGKVNTRSGNIVLTQIGDEHKEFSSEEVLVTDAPSLDADGVVAKNTAAHGEPGSELENNG